MAAKLIKIQPLSLDHYVAVGKVASNWATFEHILSSALWRLAQISDEQGACLTAQIPNTARALDAFLALVRFRGGSDTLIRRINKFSEATVALGQRRNRVIHDPWVAEMGTGQPHRFEISAQKRLVFDYRPMPTEEVNAINNEIADHIDRFGELMLAVGGELDPSREKRS